MITKEVIVKAIQNLPDDAGFEEVIDCLYVLYKVQKGLEAANAGDRVSLVEARGIAAGWSSQLSTFRRD
jgi:hypothetical protein